MKVRTKILALSVSGAAATAILIIGFVVVRKTVITDQILTIMNKEAETGATVAATDAYLMLKMQHESVGKKVAGDLQLAKAAFDERGTISLADKTTPWKAVNQFNKQVQEVGLPKMMIGKQWLGENAGSEAAASFVDTVTSLSGGDTCTIFQRMNDAGDMLRIATTVRNPDGSRAIGTYIPAVEPDGKPNPVVNALVRGQTFVGRAFVVDAWCQTAYTPILDAQKHVVGALYVGAKRKTTANSGKPS